MPTPPENGPEPGRRRNGRFGPGNRFGAAGRPPGLRSKAVEALDALGRGAGEAVVQALIDKAKQGDAQAAALLLPRIWPARKGAPVSLPMPPISTAADLPNAMAAILDMLAGGDVSAEEAESLSKVIEAARRVVETVELERRIADLEARHDDQ